MYFFFVWRELVHMYVGALELKLKVAKINISNVYICGEVTFKGVYPTFVNGVTTQKYMSCAMTSAI